uniref:Uncharacterized protein n=1 Tax=Panagrolaimus davidi TaxID=227884 RepID=A0A914PW15_9BILA
MTAKPVADSHPQRNIRIERAVVPLKDERVSNVPLVEPPPLPTVTKTEIAELKNLNLLNLTNPTTGPRMLDSPVLSKNDIKEAVKEVVAESKATNAIGGGGPPTLPSIDLIKTCTPDCTLPHCTEACKCANTHADAKAKCNPPPNAPIDLLCKIWYEKCPMFHPLSFNANGPQPFVKRF